MRNNRTLAIVVMYMYIGIISSLMKNLLMDFRLYVQLHITCVIVILIVQPVHISGVAE